jgi:Leucine-rich repeat (LRR) protein
MYALSSSVLTQVPLSTTVLMVVKSDVQVNYLAANTEFNSLRVLLLDNSVFEAAGGSSELVLQQVLQHVTETSKDLVWLKLPCADITALTHTAAVHIQSLHALRALECTKCHMLTELNVCALTQLQFLDLHECDSITRLVVDGLTQLQYVYLHMCTNLNTVEGLNELRVIKHLNLSETKAAAAALAALGELTELEHLSMNIAGESDDIPQLLPSDNSTHDELAALSALKSLMLLQHLDLSYSSRITTVDVTGLTCVQYLNLSSCSSLSALSGVDTLTALQYLHLRSCSSLCGEISLTGLKQLQLLDLSDCDMLRDVQGIDTLVSLRKLTLDQCSKLSTALDLTRLTALKYVSLHGCSSLQSVTGISQLPLLSSLDLCDCNTVSLPDEPVTTVTLASLRTLK